MLKNKDNNETTVSLVNLGSSVLFYGKTEDVAPHMSPCCEALGLMGSKRVILNLGSTYMVRKKLKQIN